MFEVCPYTHHVEGQPHKLVMEVQDKDFNNIGRVERCYEELGWDGYGPKARTYWYSDKPPVVSMHWEIPRDGPLVVVEDVVSARKVNHFAPAVALLGSNMNIDEVSAVRQAGHERMIFFLDEDKHQHQTKLAGKYSVMFPHPITCIYHNKDPKDTPMNELKELIDGA